MSRTCSLRRAKSKGEAPRRVDMSVDATAIIAETPTADAKLMTMRPDSGMEFHASKPDVGKNRAPTVRPAIAAERVRPCR